MRAIYLAGKIPKGEEVRQFSDWREDFRQLMEEKRKTFPSVKGIVYLDPHSFKGSPIPILDYFGRDVHLVSLSDALVVDGRAKLGLGTAQEMLIAKYYGKPVVAVVPRDSHYQRRTFAMGVEMDYKHPFLFSTSDAVVETFEQAADWLLGYFSGKIKQGIKGMDILDKSQEHYIKAHLKDDDVLRKWKEEMGK